MRTIEDRNVACPHSTIVVGEPPLAIAACIPFLTFIEVAPDPMTTSSRGGIGHSGPGSNCTGDGRSEPRLSAMSRRVDHRPLRSYFEHKGYAREIERARGTPPTSGDPIRGRQRVVAAASGFGRLSSKNQS